MNPIWIIGLATIVYSAYAWITFNPALKTFAYLVPLGLLLAVIGNWAWISIARSIQEPSELVIYGMLWDAMITLTFVMVPVLFFGVRFNVVSGLGCGLVLIGLTLMKIGTY